MRKVVWWRGLLRRSGDEAVGGDGTVDPSSGNTVFFCGWVVPDEGRVRLPGAAAGTVEKRKMAPAPEDEWDEKRKVIDTSPTTTQQQKDRERGAHVVRLLSYLETALASNG